MRFHEEVKVKKIKAKGKSLPVNAGLYWEDVDEEEGEFGSPENMAIDGEEDSEDSEEDSEEEQESNEDDFGGGRDAIERSKGDLFDDDDETETGVSKHNLAI